jgi:long-subunit fatty acid transport protein
MAGYRYQRSPLDNFGGPSNLLDNDRHVGSLGFEFDLQKFFPDIDARVTTALSYTVLVERTETKNFQLFTSDAALTSNPGYPSYSYGGHIVAASLGVSGHW